MVTDQELKRLASTGSLGIPLDVVMWANYFSVILERRLTKEEARDVIDRLNARWDPGPLTTLGDLERSQTIGDITRNEACELCRK